MKKVLDADILSIFEEAIQLLSKFDADGSVAGQDMPSLPSLLDLCHEASQPPTEVPLRTIHHFACSGGTLISKCIAVLPGTVILSELDPLSRLTWAPDAKLFAPTDLILALRQSAPELNEEILIDVFIAGLKTTKRELTLRGYDIVIRDHAHSQFATYVDFNSRPTLLEMLTKDFAVRSVLTVRHPLDSYLSLNNNGWVHFDPGTMDEYCRRYIAFLDRYVGVPIVKYEDFAADPEPVLGQICGYLDLQYYPLAVDAFAAINMSGDSGRTDTIIGIRSRRDVPTEIGRQAGASPHYADLCERLGYQA